MFPIAPPPTEVYNRFITNFKPNNLAIDKAIALMSLSEDDKFIKIIYSLKYDGFRRVGIELGRELGRFLIKNNMTDYDFLVPIPIHHARKRERGFNQSEFICKGINLVTHIPINTKLLKRTKYTQSQTLLTKEERKTNIQNVFSLFIPSTKLDGMTFLLVDDVLTTGSTINSAGSVLKNHGAKNVASATLAIA
jgi:ComF family protein